MKKVFIGIIAIAFTLAIGFKSVFADNTEKGKEKIEIGFIYSGNAIYTGVDSLFENIHGISLFLDPNESLNGEIYSLKSSGEITKKYRKGVSGIDIGVQIPDLWVLRCTYYQGKTAKFETSNTFFETTDSGQYNGNYQDCTRTFSLTSRFLSLEIKKGLSWGPNWNNAATFLGLGLDLSVIKLGWKKEIEIADITGYGWRWPNKKMNYLELDNFKREVFEDQRHTHINFLPFITLSQKIEISQGFGIELIIKHYLFPKDLTFEAYDYGSIIRPVTVKDFEGLELSQTLFFIRAFYQF